jgi:hypothetical protein
VDAHNNARYHYGYHFYEPVHLVELAPNALEKARAWAEKGGHGLGQAAPRAATPKVTIPGFVAHSGPFADPSGPQV